MNWSKWRLRMRPKPCRHYAHNGRQIHINRNRHLAELQQALNLPEPPNRIECYDISNTQGTAIVGAMVVFTQGVPDKKLYRKFNIESVVGAPDDFASMEEMLTRRFRRWQRRSGNRKQTRAPSRTHRSPFCLTSLSSMAVRDNWDAQSMSLKNLNCG